jgi:hypothetical protein
VTESWEWQAGGAPTAPNSLPVLLDRRRDLRLCWGHACTAPKHAPVNPDSKFHLCASDNWTRTSEDQGWTCHGVLSSQTLPPADAWLLVAPLLLATASPRLGTRAT